jgi:hypothetical protein
LLLEKNFGLPLKENPSLKASGEQAPHADARRKFGVLVPIDYSSFTATRHQHQIRIHYL